MSTRTKEALKTALAVTIAMGIALWMNWPKPYWSGFGAAIISLSTAGQSLNKGAMRMLGTLVAAVAVLAFIAWFPQQRWCFMAVVSLYVGFCSYMMTGQKYEYFWYASGFICMVIAVDAVNSTGPFQIAVERIQETGTGVLVYSLISALLWPLTSRGALEDATRKLWATQARLYRSYRNLLSGQSAAEDPRPLRTQEVQLLTQVGPLLNAAVTDSDEVREARHPWRHFLHQSTALMEALERWRQSFPEIQPLHLTTFLPNLEALDAELDLRFGQIERMLSGNTPERTPQPITLEVAHTELRALPHFRMAAVAVTATQLERLEALSRSLFDCVRDLRGYGGPASPSVREEPRQQWSGLDPDRLQGVLWVLTSLWIGFLIWIYVNPPGHASFVESAALYTMIVVRSRQWSPLAVVKALIIGALCAGVAYVFVMPHLSGYGQLGLLIFSVIFAIFYLLEGVAKTLGVVMFLAHISVTNAQTYSFASYANSVLSTILYGALIIATWYLVASSHPEKAFLRLLSRFFRQCEFLMARMALDSEPKTGLADRWKTLFYRNDLLEIPEKLAVWGARIDHRAFPDNSPEQVQAMIANLRALAFRIKDLLEARGHPPGTMLVREVIEDIRAWRTLVQEQFRLWADNPAVALEAGADPGDRLAARLARMEARLDTTSMRDGDGQHSAADYEHFYRLLGSYRGLSEAAIAYARLADSINWTQWREARF